MEEEADWDGVSGPAKSKQKVLNVLRTNIFGCDMLLCLFMAALDSLRVDRWLRPFPPMYVSTEQKDFEQLKLTCRNIPSLRNVLETPQHCSKEVFDLLAWLFCTIGHPVLQRINYKDICMPNKIEKYLEPHYVFEIIYPSKTNSLWQKRKGALKSFFVYHGSLVHKFYSILRVGLQQNFTERRELMYGTGIYLTSDITIGMLYTPFGLSWTKSGLGNKHSILAVCEVIDDVNKVKCKGRPIDNPAPKDIPDKYYVVTDSDLVRIRYLFVYKENTKMGLWTYKKLSILVIIVYVLILYANGFFHGSTWRKILKYFYKLTLDIIPY